MQKTKDILVNIDYSREEILNFFSNKDDKMHDKVEQSLDHIMKLSLKRQDDFLRNKIIWDTISESLGKYPKDIPISRDMINELSENLSYRMVDYIKKRSNKKPRKYNLI